MGGCETGSAFVVRFFPGLASRRPTSEMSECVGVMRDILDYTADGVEATTYENVTALADRQGLA